MNILHMKYAVEVARLGSLNKAAETLIIAQPNISRSIKELEADLGITIFQRSAKGMVLTPDGEEFMDYARDILLRIEKIEQRILQIGYGNMEPYEQERCCKYLDFDRIDELEAIREENLKKEREKPVQLSLFD